MKYTISLDQKFKNGKYTSEGIQAQFDIVVANELTGTEIKSQIVNRLSNSSRSALSAEGVEIKFTAKSSGEAVADEAVVKERFLKYQVILPDQSEADMAAPSKQTTTTTTVAETTTTTKAPKASKTTTTTTIV